MTKPSDFLTTVEETLLATQIITEPLEMATYLEDWRGNFTGKAAAVLLPHTTAEVSAVMKAAQQYNQVIVPQGGNTGLVGGAIPVGPDSSDPDNASGAVIVCLSRMRQIREVNIDNRSMIVEAGCILQTLHEMLEAQNLYFPLNLAAKGSCTIGGNLATNAGGVNVLRYGNARDLCLGLEVVLMGGAVMNLLSPLRKNNTGYDLRHLFIGSEGTLGIITAASLKLFALPIARATAVAAASSITGAVQMLERLQRASGERVEAFEIMPKILVDVVLKQFPALIPPLEAPDNFMLLMEIASTNAADAQTDASGETPIAQMMQSFLEAAFTDALITDATIARNSAQRQQLWDIREMAPEATKRESWPVNTDISMPVSSLDAFYRMATQAVHDIDPTIRICGYGHLGDGNLHFNLIERAGGDPDWAAKRPLITDALYKVLAEVEGSISAEHGIGRLKAAQLETVKDPVALTMMRSIKNSFDPKNLLNPGVILRSQ